MTLADAQDVSRDVMFWLGVIVAAAVVLGVIALVLRKLLIGREDAPVIGFTLSDLRRLHAEGELSDEQFDQAKRQMIAQNRALLADPEEEEGPRQAAGQDDHDDDAGETSGFSVDDAGDD